MNRCLLFVALVLPAAAMGQENPNPPEPLRYDYLGAGFAIPDLDEIGVDIEGSTAVARDLVVFGRYLNYEPNDRIDVKTLQIGVGHIWHFRRNMDFIGSLSYSDNEIDTPGQRYIEDEGAVLAGEVRGWAAPRVELSGKAMLDNSRGSGTETIIELGAQYFTDPRMSYGGRLRIDEDDTTMSLGMRWYFGASRRPLRQRLSDRP